MKSKHGSKLKELQKIKHGVCSKCKMEGRLTVDHIIPVQILAMLDRTGTLVFDWEENFELLCPTCNMFKGNRIDITNPKTRPLLVELIGRL